MTRHPTVPRARPRCPVVLWLAFGVWLAACAKSQGPGASAVEAKLGPEGGTLALPDGTQVGVPAGALAGEQTLKLEWKPATAPQDANPPGVMVSDELVLTVSPAPINRLTVSIAVPFSKVDASTDGNLLRIVEIGDALEGTGQVELMAPLRTTATATADHWQVEVSIAPPVDGLARFTVWKMKFPEVAVRALNRFDIRKDNVLDDARWAAVEPGFDARLTFALERTAMWMEQHGYEKPVEQGEIPVILDDLSSDSGGIAGFACVNSDGRDGDCTLGAARIGTGIFIDPFVTAVAPGLALERTAAHEYAHLVEGWETKSSNETLGKQRWLAEGAAEMFADQVFDRRLPSVADPTCPDFIADSLFLKNGGAECSGVTRPYEAHPYFRYLGLVDLQKNFAGAREKNGLLSSQANAGDLAIQQADGARFLDFAIQYLYLKQFDRNDTTKDALGETLEETQPWEMWGGCQLGAPYEFVSVMGRSDAGCSLKNLRPRSKAFMAAGVDDMPSNLLFDLPPLSARRIDIENTRAQEANLTLSFSASDKGAPRVAVYIRGQTMPLCGPQLPASGCSIDVPAGKHAVVVVANTKGSTDVSETTSMNVSWGQQVSCLMPGQTLCKRHLDCPVGQMCGGSGVCETCPAVSTDCSGGCPIPDLPVCRPVGNMCGSTCGPQMPPPPPGSSCCTHRGCLPDEYCSSGSRFGPVQSTGYPEVLSTNSLGTCQACETCGRSDCPCTPGDICHYTPGGPSCPCEFADCICVGYGNGCRRWTLYKPACSIDADCAYQQTCTAGFCEPCSDTCTRSDAGTCVLVIEGARVQKSCSSFGNGCAACL